MTNDINDIKLKLLLFSFSCAFLISCNGSQSDTVQIGENTFVHESTVYRIIDNEITELGSLKSDSITKSDVLSPDLRDFSSFPLDYVKPGASSTLVAVYRGDELYFKMEVLGLNDLSSRFTRGVLTILFEDTYRFRIHEERIEMYDMTRIVGNGGETIRYEYNGKAKMSSEIYRAITRYSVESSLR